MGTPRRATPPEAGPGTRTLVRRRVLQLGIHVLVQAAVLLLGSGRTGWTNAIGILFAVSGLGLLVVAVLDARFAWSAPVPFALSVAGLALFLAGFGLATWAMASNRFFSSVVRIQADRGHAVATGGPSRFVRHPGYAGFTVGAFGTALLLGSRWALVPATLSAVLVVVRTALEDRTLRAELPGYADYAARVRYRLLPRVW